jgi:two-component system nitrate/nitrite response regulator NarL
MPGWGYGAEGGLPTAGCAHCRRVPSEDVGVGESEVVGVPQDQHVQGDGQVAPLTAQVRAPGALRVAVLDGHTLFAQSLEVALGPASDGRIEVVGTAGTVGDGLRLVAEANPDLLLVDLALPPTGAAELLRAVRRRPFVPRLMVMSSADDLDGAIAALADGADAFLPKSARPDELLAPLLAVLQGWTVMSRPFAEHLLHRSRRPAAVLTVGLDDRDRALWRLVAQGLEITTIAERLFVSERTAKRLVADLRTRLGARSRIEMAALAGRSGLLDDDPLGGDVGPVEPEATSAADARQGMDGR